MYEDKVKKKKKNKNPEKRFFIEDSSSKKKEKNEKVIIEEEAIVEEVSEEQPNIEVEDTQEVNEDNTLESNVGDSEEVDEIEVSKDSEPSSDFENFFVSRFQALKKRFSREEKKAHETQFLGIKADWTSIVIKLILFLIVAFLIIFVFTKLRSKGHSFTDNIEKMKDVSYTYYKVASHRPSAIGEEVMMTLEDMEKGSLISELKDEKNNICSKEYSTVSLKKQSDSKYDLTVYLSCGGVSNSAFYEVSFDSGETSDNSSKTVLYELKRTVKNDNVYSCPDGYMNSGRYCIKTNNTVVVDATPKYRLIPAINTPAIYKSGDKEYETVEPIVQENEKSLVCPRGYTLKNGKCESEGNVYYNNASSYSCPNGGTLSGSRCLFSVNASYSNEQLYCKNGVSQNGRCYVTQKYSVRCIYGRRDANNNACYTTYSSYSELSDWLFDSVVTYSSSRNVTDTDRTRYEVDEYLDNGKIRYKRYVRVSKKTCDEGDVLDGSICKHYDESYEERYCSNSKYSLNANQSECYAYEDMAVKSTVGTYSCPSGYTSSGTGSNKKCYKYENALKNENKTAYCASSKYALTSDGRCVSVVEPTVVENEKMYSCPEGFTKVGSGKSTRCIRKTQKEGYYYCASSTATLSGDRCVVSEKTEFMGYSCPSGYKVSGSQCVKENATETILATKNSEVTISEETIWSKTKDVSGWTWTGNTKEE